jgi:hypothetical protein
MAASMPDVLPRVADQPLAETQTTPLPPQPTLATRELNFSFRGTPWCVRIELSDDPAESDWLSVSDRPSDGTDPDTIEIRVSMAHPFMVARQARCAAASLRSWQPIQQRTVPAVDDGPRCGLLDEPLR